MRKNGMEDSDDSDVEEDIDFENPQASSSSLLGSPSTDSDDGAGQLRNLTPTVSTNDSSESGKAPFFPTINPTNLAASSMLFRNLAQNPMLAAAAAAAANRGVGFFPNPITAAFAQARNQPLPSMNFPTTAANSSTGFQYLFQQLMTQQVMFQQQAQFIQQQQRQQQLLNLTVQQQQQQNYFETTTPFLKSHTPTKRSKLLIDDILNLKTSATSKNSLSNALKLNKNNAFSMRELITSKTSEKNELKMDIDVPNNEDEEDPPTDTSGNSSGETSILQNNNQHDEGVVIVDVTKPNI